MAIPGADQRAERQPGPPGLGYPAVTLEGVRDVLARLPHLDQLHGFGVFGSLGGQQARRFDPERSDIDVFLVIKDAHWSDTHCDRWVRRVTDALERAFRRRVDVLVFTLRALRKVPGWHAISMASDCPVLYDPEGEVARVFAHIVEAARAADLAQVWVGDQRLWRKQHWVIGENIVVEVPDDEQ